MANVDVQCSSESLKSDIKRYDIDSINEIVERFYCIT